MKSRRDGRKPKPTNGADTAMRSAAGSLRPGDPLRDLEEAQELLAVTPNEPSAKEVARLGDRAREWAGDQAFQALGRVANTIAGNLDFRSLVEQILDVAIDTVGAERGIIFLGRSGASELVPAVARSVGGEDLKALERVSRTIVSRGKSGETVTSVDAFHDPRFSEVPSVRLNRIRSVICVPLVARGERIGAIYVDHLEAQAFSSHAQTFLEVFASLAAVALENARLHGDLYQENVRIRQQLGTLDSFGRIVTASPAMRDVLRRAATIAKMDTPLMLLGESGTGKELLARAIHESGPRALQPFIAYNCAAVPRDLMESLFFGHMRGSFTGALRDAPGLFRQADRGVLLLDEIAELDGALQAKLLRVLQDGIVRPVGGDREIQVDVRVITATSRDLTAAVRARTFREDLFYRLNVIELRVPPLRERPEDIPILIDHFRRKHGAGSPPMTVADDVVPFMQTLPWRGNVRELENFVQRALLLGGKRRLTVALAAMLLGAGESGVAPGSPEGAATGGGIGGRGPATIPEQERAAILHALRTTGGNKTRAAGILGIHRNSLVRRMERLKVRWDT